MTEAFDEVLSDFSLADSPANSRVERFNDESSREHVLARVALTYSRVTKRELCRSYLDEENKRCQSSITRRERSLGPRRFIDNLERFSERGLEQGDERWQSERREDVRVNERREETPRRR